MKARNDSKVSNSLAIGIIFLIIAFFGGGPFWGMLGLLLVCVGGYRQFKSQSTGSLERWGSSESQGRLPSNGSPYLPRQESPPPSSQTLGGTRYDLPNLKVEVSLDSRANPSNISARSELLWAGQGHVLSVGSYRLVDPNVYFSESDPIELEASCIIKRLKVGKPIQEPSGALGYWPTYERMTPDQRANYLHWLASGKHEPLDDIGYAFVYFYGLERRALVYNLDQAFILDETERLLRTYTTSRSFTGYLSRFIAYLTIQGGLDAVSEERLEWLLRIAPPTACRESLAIALAWYFKHEKPLPIDLARLVAQQDPRTSRSVVLDRVPEQFSTLFNRKYESEFGEGMRLKGGRGQVAIKYGVASPTCLIYSHRQAIHRIPDILGNASQFAPLVAIWQQCIDELKSYSRKAATVNGTLTREAYETMPEALREDLDHPDKELWAALAGEYIGEDGICLIPVSRLAALHEIELRSKLTLKQSKALATTAQHVGFLLEPDARITGRAYGWNDTIALIRYVDSAAMTSVGGYVSASCILELSMAVAGADGEIDEEEQGFVSTFVEEQFVLSPIETRRLQALMKVLLQQPPTASAVGKRLQATLPMEQRETVAEFLVGVAAVNGIIDKKESAALKTLYKALELDEEKLSALLRRMRRAGEEGAEIRISDESSRPDEAIPPRPDSAQSSAVALNDDLVRKILSETAEVAKILGTAMGDGVHDEPSDRDDASSDIQEAPRFIGLDPRYHSLLATLLTSETWPSGTFASLVREQGLMPANAVAVINEWAEEAWGDLLIEEGDPLTIQLALVKELA